MSESMVERVARASHEFFRPLYKLPPWEDIPDTHKSVGLQHARALLEAIRRPTDEMAFSARDRYESDLNGVGATIIGCLYMAMIDAAMAGA